MAWRIRTIWRVSLIGQVSPSGTTGLNHKATRISLRAWMLSLILLQNTNVTKYGASLDVSVSPKQLTKIHTHYIYSMVVQDFVSGRACCVNKTTRISLRAWMLWLILLQNNSPMNQFVMPTIVKYSTVKWNTLISEYGILCIRYPEIQYSVPR
jgi:hypothetical protein